MIALSLSGLAALLLITEALAGAGDQLRVTGDVVNVRAGPTTDASIRMQVLQGTAATEMTREGAWVRVLFPQSERTGWIHGSLVETVRVAAPSAAQAAPSAPPEEAPEAPAQTATAPATATNGASALPEPAAGPESGATTAAVQPDGESASPVDAAAVNRFRDSVAYLNERAVSAAGVDLFSDVRAADPTTVQVVATPIWRTVPESGRQSYLSTLFDRWLAASGSTAPITVEIVDETGRVLSTRTGP